MSVEEPTWPWEAKEVNLKEPYNEISTPQSAKGSWALKTSVIGKYCLAQWGGPYNMSVGNLSCLGQKYYNASSQAIL